jgi:catalase
VNRTYANAASIEFDALVLVGELPPAPDAMVSGDTKAGAGSSRIASDPRVIKLIGEAWRHSKAIGAIASGESASLTDVDITGDDEGVVVGTAKEVALRMLELLAEHRVWGRFATSAEV